jgi:hypothetical protein
MFNYQVEVALKCGRKVREGVCSLLFPAPDGRCAQIRYIMQIEEATAYFSHAEPQLLFGRDGNDHGHSVACSDAVAAVVAPGSPIYQEQEGDSLIEERQQSSNVIIITTPHDHDIHKGRRNTEAMYRVEPGSRNAKQRCAAVRRKRVVSRNAKSPLGRFLKQVDSNDLSQ